VTKEKINSIETQAALKKVQQGYDDARIAAEQYLATIARRNAREIEGVGRGQRFREDQANRGAIDERAQAERRRLEGELRRQQITREQFDTYLAFVEDTYRKEVSMYEERSARLDELQRDWLVGAEEALNNYIDMTKDTAKQFEDAFSKAFSSIEDFIGDLTSGGIKSFKDFGNAVNKLVLGIAADFAKIEIREKITGPLAELV
jgi:lambda family phage tail tape measure protein